MLWEAREISTAFSLYDFATCIASFAMANGHIRVVAGNTCGVVRMLDGDTGARLAEIGTPSEMMVSRVHSVLPISAGDGSLCVVVMARGLLHVWSDKRGDWLGLPVAGAANSWDPREFLAAHLPPSPHRKPALAVPWAGGSVKIWTM